MNLTLPPGRPLTSACAQAQALARRTSWWLPGDLTAFTSSPPGKKNSRGAARLRQIEPGYKLLPQIRRGVTACRRTPTASPVRRGHPEAVLGCVLSPRDFPWCQPRQTPPGGELPEMRGWARAHLRPGVPVPGLIWRGCRVHVVRARCRLACWRRGAAHHGAESTSASAAPPGAEVILHGCRVHAALTT